MDAACTTGTVCASVSVTGTPTGGVPVAVAVFAIDPASMSACVTVYDAVHVVEAPGVSVVTGHATADRPDSGSVTPIEVRVTLPALATRNE